MLGVKLQLTSLHRSEFSCILFFFQGLVQDLSSFSFVNSAAYSTGYFEQNLLINLQYV